jgi:regulator of protease activity HflC (stomatin/prohibitin superfamily)
MENSGFKITRKQIILAVLGLFLFAWVVIAIDIVQTGNTQVVTRFGKVVRTNGEGLAFHIPLVERTKSIDTTIRRESATAVAATSNLQQVTTDVAVNYRITQENAVKQYQNFTKKDFVQIIVQPKIQDSIKAVTPTYTAETLVLDRAKVAADIKGLIEKALGEYGIDVVDVSITNFSFSDDYTKAVADKSVLVQQVAAAKLNTEKVELEGQNNILAAQKAAAVRALEAQATEKNIELTKLELQRQAMSKWNGVMPTTMTSDTSILSIPVK